MDQYIRVILRMEWDKEKEFGYKGMVIDMKVEI